jgi:tRNA (adenine22-N1)-methyltransferase
MILSDRLEICLRFTKGFKHLADIGTDHALLPIEAVKRGYVQDAIATDNKYGPYIQALNNVKKESLQTKVEVLLGEGLSVIANNTEVVVISGMGGETITQILKTGDLKNIKRLILQPNRNVELVRKTIVFLDYKIINEFVIEESPRFYDVLIVEKGNAQYTQLDLKYGPINLRYKSPSFLKRLKKDYLQLNAIVKNVEHPSKKEEILKTIAEMELIINERERIS